MAEIEWLRLENENRKINTEVIVSMTCNVIIKMLRSLNGVCSEINDAMLFLFSHVCFIITFIFVVYIGFKINIKKKGIGFCNFHL